MWYAGRACAAAGCLVEADREGFRGCKGPRSTVGSAEALVDSVEVVPKPLQIRRPGPELPSPPQRLSVGRERGLMRGPAGHIDSQCQRHRRPPVQVTFPGSQVTDHHGHGPDVL
jgi:hypothetical protein